MDLNTKLYSSLYLLDHICNLAQHDVNFNMCASIASLFLTALCILYALSTSNHFSRAGSFLRTTHTDKHLLLPHISHTRSKLLNLPSLPLTVSSTLFSLCSLYSPSWFYYTDSSVWQLWPVVECYTYTHLCTHPLTHMHACTRSQKLLPSPAGTCKSYPCEAWNTLEDLKVGSHSRQRTVTHCAHPGVRRHEGDAQAQAHSIMLMQSMLVKSSSKRKTLSAQQSYQSMSFLHCLRLEMY